MDNLAGIGAQIFMDRILSTGPQSKIGLTLMVLSVFLVLIALAFFIFSIYVWLSATYRSGTAAIFTSGIALSAAVLLFLMALAVVQSRQSYMRQVREETASVLHEVFEYVDEELSEPIQENPKTAALVAAVAGFAMGERLR